MESSPGIGVSSIEDSKLERLNIRDAAQISIGSFVGALVFITSTDLIEISDKVPFLNVFMITAITILFSYMISYVIGIRRLGRKKIRMLFGVVPERTLIQYSSALFFSMFLLYLLGVNSSAGSWTVMLKRIFVLAMPSTITAAAADLIESQKWTKTA